MTSLKLNYQTRYSTVGISGQYISEYDGDVQKLSIPVKEIMKISLLYGSPVERPIANLLVCVALLGLGGLLGLMPLYSIIKSGDTIQSGYSLKLYVMALPLILVGGWYFSRFFQKKYYLNIETEKGTRKIVFENSENEQKVRFFIDQVKKRYGIDIHHVWNKKKL